MNPKKFLALIVIASVLASSIALGLKRLVMPPPPPATADKAITVPSPFQPELPKEQRLPDADLTQQPPTPQPTPDAAKPKLTGILRKGQQITLVMSDGTTRTEQDNIPKSRGNIPGAGKRVVEYVAKNFAIINGERHYLQPKENPRSGQILTPIVNSVSKEAEPTK